MDLGHSRSNRISVDEMKMRGDLAEIDGMMWDKRGIPHLSRTQGALPHWNPRCLHTLRLLLHLQAAVAAGDDDVGRVADHDLLLLLRLPLGCSLAL